jgi:hypothetical protein
MPALLASPEILTCRQIFSGGRCASRCSLRRHGYHRAAGFQRQAGRIGSAPVRGLPPMIRVDGDMRRINLPPLEHKQVHR